MNTNVMVTSYKWDLWFENESSIYMRTKTNQSTSSTCSWNLLVTFYI